MKTATLKNARVVWEHVIDFVECHDMAQRVPPPPKAAKVTFQMASAIYNGPPRPKSQSPAPVPIASAAEPCVGSSAAPPRPSQLSQEHMDLIEERRAAAAAAEIKRAKQQGTAGEDVAAPNATTRQSDAGAPQGSLCCNKTCAMHCAGTHCSCIFAGSLLQALGSL